MEGDDKATRVYYWNLIHRDSLGNELKTKENKTNKQKPPKTAILEWSLPSGGDVGMLVYQILWVFGWGFSGVLSSQHFYLLSEDSRGKSPTHRCRCGHLNPGWNTLKGLGNMEEH